MKKITSLVIAGLFSIAAGSAFAAEVPTFDAADADGNGAVDQAEFAKAKEAGAEQPFAELDKDGNGSLSKEEYAVLLGEDCE